MKLTPEELAAMPEKTRKHQEVVDLYLKHEFLKAYALHTDMRVERDGYRAAVGAAHDWERHGELQFGFLKGQGLQPHHRLLEIGCGTGRLARKVVPYLDEFGYVGVDISVRALHAAIGLADHEGWISKSPIFSPIVPPSSVAFDVAWSFSVFIHVPSEVMTARMREVAQHLKPAGRFYFSYVPEEKDERTGLKQFRHSEATYRKAAADAGLTFKQVRDWGGEQRMAVARRIA